MPPVWLPATVLAAIGIAFALLTRRVAQRMGRSPNSFGRSDTAHDFVGRVYRVAGGMLFAFLYGVVHTLGPGHGKFVIASYFVGRDASIWRGLRMASEIAVTHVIAAVLLVWLTDVAVRVLFGAATGELYWSRLISYGVLAAIGAWMLAQAVQRLVGARAANAHDAACRHDHGGGPGGAGEGRQRGLLSIGVGVAPCTGAILVMVFALANDVLVAGPHVPAEQVALVKRTFVEHSAELVKAILTGDENQKYQGMQFVGNVDDHDYDYVRAMYRSIGRPQFAEFVGE